MDYTARDWVDTRALARALGVSTDAALNWPRGKGFPSYAVKRFGRRIYWHLPTVVRWREGRLRALEHAPRGLGGTTASPAVLIDDDGSGLSIQPPGSRALPS